MLGAWDEPAFCGACNQKGNGFKQITPGSFECLLCGEVSSGVARKIEEED